MGIYAPKVNIPKNCCVCGFSRTANYRKKDIENGFHAIGGRMCSITGNVMPMYCSYRTKMRECPLVPVPPHGRLIDADALIADLKRQCKEVFRIDAVSPDDFWITRNQAYNERLWTTWCESLYDYINTAPTIIETEDSDLS